MCGPGRGRRGRRGGWKRGRSICDFFFFQAEDGIRDYKVTGVQTCALPILGDNFQTFGAIRPGATTTVSLEIKPANQTGQPVYTRIYGSAFFNGPQTSQPTEIGRASCRERV